MEEKRKSEKVVPDGDLIEFLKTNVMPPLVAESIDEVFRKYGMVTTGVADGWYWFTKDNITEVAIKHGHRPIEEASETEIWKMIALCERYWRIFYEGLYRETQHDS